MKNYFIKSIFLIPILLFSSCSSNNCWVCEGDGKNNCIVCVDGKTAMGECAFCDAKGIVICTFCNGTGNIK